MTWASADLPLASVTVHFTGYVPGFSYLCLTNGEFWVTGRDPSPKSNVNVLHGLFCASLDFDASKSTGSYGNVSGGFDSKIAVGGPISLYGAFTLYYLCFAYYIYRHL